MIVCVAEKPSVGQYIAKVLGATQRRDGYFEGNGYCVTWTFGHLCALLDPQEYTEQWKNWNLSSLPMIPPRFSIKVNGDEGVHSNSMSSNRLLRKPTRLSTVVMPGRRGN